MRRLLAAVLASFCINLPPGGSLVPQVAAAPSDVSVTIDASQTFQRIDGFGVNANARSWNDGQLAPALDMLVDQMGANIFRVILEKSDWQPSSTSDPWIYESAKFQNLWGTIGYLNSKHVTVMLNLMGGIPDWMGGTTLNPSLEDEWVNMVTSMLVYGRATHHVQINLLSPMNEEDIGAPEGPRLTPEQYVRVMDKLAARMAAVGLDDIRLVGPDTASPVTGASNYALLMFADPGLMSRIDHLAVHTYSSDTGPMAVMLRQHGYDNRDLWVTEWSAWCQGCDHGQPVQAEWQFAADSTEMLLDHLEHGASAALVYEGYDSYYEHHGAYSYWGQLSFDPDSGAYTPRQRFYTNAQVFRSVTPGMLRVGSSSSDNAVHVVAFRDPDSGNVAIVGHNSGMADTTLTISFRGLQPQAGSPSHLYQTTFSSSFAQGPDTALAPDGTVRVGVAGDSFFSLSTTGSRLAEAANVSPVQPITPITPAAVGQDTTGLLVGSADQQLSTDTDAAGTAEAFMFTAGRSGFANKLHVYIAPGSAATHVEVGLYDDSNGSPGKLLASAALSSPNVRGWNAADIPAVQVQSGDDYWIAILGAAGSGDIQVLDAGDSGGKSVTSANRNLTALPASWSSGETWTSSPVSAYAAQEP